MEVKLVNKTRLEEEDSRLVTAFTAKLDDDLNVAGGWGVIFEWVRDTNRRLNDYTLTPETAEAAIKAWTKIDSVLGIADQNQIEIPAEIVALLEDRQAARKARDFKRADAIRDELKAKGWVIEDTPKGPKLKKL